jgi:hypothetical protein
MVITHYKQNIWGLRSGGFGCAAGQTQYGDDQGKTWDPKWFYHDKKVFNLVFPTNLRKWWKYCQ